MGKLRLAATLRDLATDLSLGNGTTEQVSALYEAIKIVERPTNWATVEESREELRRMSRQLDAISSVCRNMADKIADLSVEKPTAKAWHPSNNREAMMFDAFDSILHPSYYRRLHNES